MTIAVLQFGTSRFLQAHVDLFIGEAPERGEAPGRIAVVQTTGNPQSVRRIAQNHAQKKRRRLLPVIDLARQLAPALPQPRLHAAPRLDEA